MSNEDGLDGTLTLGEPLTGYEEFAPQPVHDKPYPFADKTVLLNPAWPYPSLHLTKGLPFTITDWADRVYGLSWRGTVHASARIYAMRATAAELPIDDRVLYGTTMGGEVALIHVKEIGAIYDV